MDLTPKVVELNLPLGKGWFVTEAMTRAGSPLVLVRLKNSGTHLSENARLDIGKEMFLDPVAKDVRTFAGSLSRQISLLVALQATKASEISVYPTPRSPPVSSSDQHSYTAENPGKVAIVVDRHDKEWLVTSGATEAASHP